MTMNGHYRTKQRKLVVFQELSENYREHTAKSMKVKQSKVKYFQCMKNRLAS